MASTDLTTTYLKLWLQSDANSIQMQKKFLMAGIDTRHQKSSDIFARMKKGPDAWNPAVQWLERTATQQMLTGQLATATITVSGTLLGAAVTASSLKQHVRVDTILERRSDGLQMKVTACDYANLALTVAAHGNTGSLSNDSGAVAYDILGEASSDYNETHQPKSTGAMLRTVGTQIHEETFEAPETWISTRFEEIEAKLRDQLAIIVEGLRMKIARCAVRIAPVYSGGAYITGLATANPTMTGLAQWPRILQGECANTNVYRNKAAAELYIDDLDNLVYYMENDEQADFGRGSWFLCYNPVQQKPISELLIQYRRMAMDDRVVGFSVGAYAAKNGKTFQLQPDWHMPLGMILVANLSACEWGYFVNDQIHVKDLPTQSRTIKKLVSCQTYGVVVRNPRSSVGTIYGLPTAY